MGSDMNEDPKHQGPGTQPDSSEDLRAIDQAMVLALSRRQRGGMPLSASQEQLLDDWVLGLLSASRGRSSGGTHQTQRICRGTGARAAATGCSQRGAGGAERFGLAGLESVSAARTQRVVSPAVAGVFGLAMVRAGRRCRSNLDDRNYRPAVMAATLATAGSLHRSIRHGDHCRSQHPFGTARAIAHHSIQPGRISGRRGASRPGSTHDCGDLQRNPIDRPCLMGHVLARGQRSVGKPDPSPSRRRAASSTWRRMEGAQRISGADL